MATSTRLKRGSYAKTQARRHSIVQAALDLCKELPVGAKITLKAIAQRAQMSEAGVLHHFPTMNELYTAVLVRRDEEAQQRFGLFGVDDVVGYMSSTFDEPRLTELYIEMSLAAKDPAHPASEFVRRHRRDAAAVIRQAKGGRMNSIPGTSGILSYNRH